VSVVISEMAVFPGKQGSTKLEESLGPRTSVVQAVNADHLGVVNALFLDGHVASISKRIDLGIWRGLSTRAGKEVFPKNY
jgi:prepilin-type processing-associated H-X9-DG protein